MVELVGARPGVVELAEWPAEVVEAVRQTEVAGLVEVRLAVVGSAEVELVERPVEVRLAERPAGALGVVRRMETVEPVKVRLVVVELVEVKVIERPAEE